MAATLTAAGPAGTRAHNNPARTRAHEETFVVTTHKVRDRSGGIPQGWVPYGVQHAWTPGSRKTLCGEWTNGWTVFWERTFSARPAESCPACVEATLPPESRRRLDSLASPLAR
jgi:hypothetical protein